MKKILIIGGGIAGLTCAIECAGLGMEATICSPFPSERAQSVLAAGGINAVLATQDSNDSIESHIEDTLKGGCDIAGPEAVEGLCREAPDIIAWLEKLGTVFSRDESGRVSRREFGGQSHRRTCYCGASTGKQIVTALVMEVRRFEAKGLIKRRLWSDFYCGLIKDGTCYGAVLYNEATGQLEAVYADALVVATGGQNSLFGKTTGSTQCDGYAAGRLFMQGLELKNLEFIQYHPTTIETDQKHMLISEAARGEGGRLYYMDGDTRVYFMEDLYGDRGNLMPRDIVSKHISECGKQVYLDLALLGKDKISKRIPEVYDLCRKYLGLDITRESIPVTPAVHFFMGGIAVKNDHETNIENLYAIGECASIYHGANRLGGNSLLAAIHGGRVAARSLSKKPGSKDIPDFDGFLEEEKARFAGLRNSESTFPVMYIRDMVAETMQKDLGISRTGEGMEKGLEDISYYISIADKIHFDRSEMAYFGYSLEGLLTLAKATLTCALGRKESRGAHIRRDYPEKDDSFKWATIIRYDNGNYTTYLDKEGKYEV